MNSAVALSFASRLDPSAFELLCRVTKASQSLGVTIHWIARALKLKQAFGVVLLPMCSDVGSLHLHHVLLESPFLTSP